MAKQYYATTRIKHGTDEEPANPRDPVKHTTRIFEEGDLVTGLTAKDMRDLWDAGALEERDSSSKADTDETRDDSEDLERGPDGKFLPREPKVVESPGATSPNATADTVITPSGDGKTTAETKK